MTAAADWIITSSQVGDFTLAKEYGDVSLCTVPVKLFDDDGMLYLTGKISRRMLDGPEEIAFFLLNEASADLGATRMDYQDPKTGKWETL